MIDCADPLDPSSPVNLFVSEDTLLGSARRSDLAMEFLSIMSDHETGIDDATDTAEAIAVFIATACYICVEFGIPELKLLSDVKRLHKQFTIAKSRLGPRSTARDMFCELAVMAEDSIKPVSKVKQTKPVKKSNKK